MKRALAIVLLAASGAFGQCVMCFRTAAAQQSERARVMNVGIIIMLIPPVVILAGFMVLFYKRRQTYAVAEPPDENFVADPELTAVMSGDRQ
jgi:heme/copper-type cytochrome/quinol oxidase subunit 2